jgi:hypothetical protein
LPDAIPGGNSGLYSNRSVSGFMPRDSTVSCIARRRHHGWERVQVDGGG